MKVGDRVKIYPRGVYASHLAGYFGIVHKVWQGSPNPDTYINVEYVDVREDYTGEIVYALESDLEAILVKPTVKDGLWQRIKKKLFT